MHDRYNLHFKSQAHGRINFYWRPQVLHSLQEHTKWERVVEHPPLKLAGRVRFPVRSWLKTWTMVLAACPASCAEFNGWMQNNGSRAVMPLTPASAAFTVNVAARPKLAARPTAQTNVIGRRRPLVTLHRGYEASVMKLNSRSIFNMLFNCVFRDGMTLFSDSFLLRLFQLLILRFVANESQQFL